MTNEDLLQDLKQFISATVSQQTADLEKRIYKVEQRLDDTESRLVQRIDALDAKIDLVQDAIAEAFTHVSEANKIAFQSYKHRLLRLEHGAT